MMPEYPAAVSLIPSEVRELGPRVHGGGGPFGFVAGVLPGLVARWGVNVHLAIQWLLCGFIAGW